MITQELSSTCHDQLKYENDKVNEKYFFNNTSRCQFKTKFRQTKQAFHQLHGVYFSHITSL